jgi:uncharacterized protein (DUF2062 family)
VRQSFYHGYIFATRFMKSAIETLRVKLIKLIRAVWSKETLKRIGDQFYNPNETDGVKVFSFGFGIFMGIIPIWGFQTLAAIFLSTLFKLNKTLVGIGALISIPPMMPVIIYLSYKIGGYWMGNNAATRSSLQNFNARLLQYVFGSITLAIIAGLTFSLLTFLMLKVVKLVKQYRLTASWTRLNNRLLVPSISITLK